MSHSSFGTAHGEQPCPAKGSAQATRAQCRPGLLIVEDEDFIREMLVCLLEQHGFAVWQAATGQEAVERCRTCHAEIAAVLLDLNLPDLDGRQVLAALREINPSLRCCFMTGASDMTMEVWQDHGADRLFLKPFPLDEVVAALQELTGALNLVG